MGKTQTDVIEELRMSGLQVDGRRLTNWRAKALLPPLTSRSLGRAGGHAYWWEEENIVDRAMAVHDILSANRDAHAALVSIWLAGFPVPTTTVIKGWLTSLEKGAKRYRKLAERHGEEDTPQALADTHAQALARRIGLKRSATLPAVEEISALIYADDYDPTSGAEAFANLSKQFAAKTLLPTEVIGAIDGRPIDTIIGFFKSFGTNKVVRALLSTTPCAVIETAYAQWIEIWSIINRLLPDSALPRPGIYSKPQLAASCGRYALPALISLNVRGEAPRIKHSIDLIGRNASIEELSGLFSDYAASAKINPAGQQTLKIILAEMGDIWELPNFARQLANSEWA